MRRLLSLLAALMLAVTPALADTLTIPYSFSAGDTITASKFNNNFTAITSVINGLIDDNNIKVGAGIQLSKLAATSELFILRTAANRALSAGTTGDTVPRLTLDSSGRILFGAGSASAQDIMIKRNSSTQLSIRDAGDTADRDLSARALTLSTPLSAANGGTGLASAGSDGNILTASSGVWVSSAPSATSVPSTNGGRLTLTSGTPVTTTDVTAAGTIYWEPKESDQIALWTGSVYQLVSVGSNKSLALTATSGSVYDVFGYLSGGTLALESLVWTNTTTRATAIVRDANGVYTKSGDRTRRYLGSFYATGTNQTEDSTSRRCLYNYYNRARRFAKAIDSATSWTYASATYRAANANTTDGQGRFAFVTGVVEDAIEVRLTQGFTNSSALGQPGIGIDSTTTSSALTNACNNGSSGVWNNTATYMGLPAVGYHYVQALEACSSAGTVTFYGTASTTGQQFNSQSGLTSTLYQ